MKYVADTRTSPLDDRAAPRRQPFLACSVFAVTKTAPTRGRARPSPSTRGEIPVAIKSLSLTTQARERNVAASMEERSAKTKISPPIHHLRRYSSRGKGRPRELACRQNPPAESGRSATPCAAPAGRCFRIYHLRYLPYKVIKSHSRASGGGNPSTARERLVNKRMREAKLERMKGIEPSS